MNQLEANGTTIEIEELFFSSHYWTNVVGEFLDLDNYYDLEEP